MKIGVSGASGHLGRAVVSELLQRPDGHEVGVEEGVERGEPGGVGGRGAEADVTVRPHQERTRSDGGTVRAADDLDEPAPAPVQALDTGGVRGARDQEVVRRPPE